MRILCLGESTTYQGFNKSWPQILQNRLNELNYGYPITVINKGQPGIDTSEILQNLPHYIDQYRPHIVISMMGINDRGIFVKYENFWWSKTLIYKFIASYFYLNLSHKSLHAHGVLAEYSALNTIHEKYVFAPNEKNYYDLFYFQKYKEFIDKVPPDSVKSHSLGFQLAYAISKTQAEEIDVGFEMILKILTAEENFNARFLLLQHLSHLKTNNNSYKNKLLTELNSTLMLKPEYAELQFTAGRIHEFHFQDHIAAYRHYSLALEAFPCHAGSLWARNQIADKANKLEDALQTTEACIDQINNSRVFLPIISHHLRLNNVERVRSLILKLYDRFPDSFTIKKFYFAIQDKSILSNADDINYKLTNSDFSDWLLHKNYSDKTLTPANLSLASYKTVENYRSMNRILSNNNIQHVAVQYPNLSTLTLQYALEERGKYILVENISSFKAAQAQYSYDGLFTDRFGGSFGHLTPLGNEILANSIFKKLIEQKLIVN